uniref:Predicted protein n=1 Tax=Hordeum vulgare subsp. vulgare TaxID=112509 RepID=F2EGH9_HORVV|nr:predicted protein [Hordeum vulgare subsp. vulgare]
MEPAVRVQLAGLGEDNRQEGLCRRSSPHPLRPLLEAQFERATWRSQIRGGSGSPTSFPRYAPLLLLPSPPLLSSDCPRLRHSLRY